MNGARPSRHGRTSQPKPNSSNGYTKQDLESLASFFKIVKNYIGMKKLEQRDITKVENRKQK